MSNMPKDLVVISEPAPTIAGLDHPTYSVHFVRVRDNDDMDELLHGKLLEDMDQSHILLKGEIPPHGEAKTVRPIRSMEQAVHLVKAILADEGSAPRRAGIAPSTPIYHARPGQPLSPV